MVKMCGVLVMARRAKDRKGFTQDCPCAVQDRPSGADGNGGEA